jgi:hypothetical protein
MKQKGNESSKETDRSTDQPRTSNTSTRSLSYETIYRGPSSTARPAVQSDILNLAASTGAFGTRGHISGDASSSNKRLLDSEPKGEQKRQRLDDDEQQVGKGKDRADTQVPDKKEIAKLTKEAKAALLPLKTEIRTALSGAKKRYETAKDRPSETLDMIGKHNQLEQDINTVYNFVLNENVSLFKLIGAIKNIKEHNENSWGFDNKYIKNLVQKINNDSQIQAFLSLAQFIPPAPPSH